MSDSDRSEANASAEDGDYSDAKWRTLCELVTVVPKVTRGQHFWDVHGAAAANRMRPCREAGLSICWRWCCSSAEVVRRLTSTAIPISRSHPKLSAHRLLALARR